MEPIDVDRVRAQIDDIQLVLMELNLMAVRVILPVRVRSASFDAGHLRTGLIWPIELIQGEHREVR